MRNIAIALTAGTLLTAAAPAWAQFVPTLGSDTPRVCPDQPLQPDWIENIAPRDAHRGNLVQEIYRAHSMQAVIDAGDCACDIRFPTWEAAEAVYAESYSGIKDRWEIIDLTSEYSKSANDFRRVAKPLCEEQGNW